MSKKFIKAVFNADKMTLTAFTNDGRCEDFDVYTQEEYEKSCTIEALAEHLKELDELPEDYSSYEEYAEEMQDSIDKILFDFSYSDQWDELCKMAGISAKDYRLSWSASYPASMYDY